MCLRWSRSLGFGFAGRDAFHRVTNSVGLGLRALGLADGAADQTGGTRFTRRVGGQSRPAHFTSLRRVAHRAIKTGFYRFFLIPRPMSQEMIRLQHPSESEIGSADMIGYRGGSLESGTWQMISRNTRMRQEIYLQRRTEDVGLGTFSSLSL